jgi:transposase
MTSPQQRDPRSSVTEGVRRTTVGTDDRPRPLPTASSAPIEIATTEVVARTTRRRLSLAYKLKVLDTVAHLRTQEHGVLGAFLRQEGLYYASVRAWERLHANGKLTAQRKGKHGKSREALFAENKKLRRALEQSEKRLAKTELLVELQKKLSAILDLDAATQQENNDEQ